MISFQLSSFDIHVHVYGQNADGFMEHCIQMKEFFGDYSFYFISSICTIYIQSINRYWLAKNVFRLVRPLKLKTVKSLLEYFFILGTEKKYKNRGVWMSVVLNFHHICSHFDKLQPDSMRRSRKFLIFKGGGGSDGFLNLPGEGGVRGIFW